MLLQEKVMNRMTACLMTLAIAQMCKAVFLHYLISFYNSAIAGGGSGRGMGDWSYGSQS